MEQLTSLIRAVPDFPSPGVVFRDITPLLGHPEGLSEVTRQFELIFANDPIDLVAGVESRGFLFGAPLAMALGVGFVPIRKLGKLPARTVQREYALEYGTGHLEVHVDAITPGQRVLLVDDVLATGGTARVGMELVEELGGEVVAAAFVLEISMLGGRARLTDRRVVTLLQY